MTEIRNVEADLAQFRTRVLLIGLAVVFAFGLIAARMVYLQVMRHDDLLAPQRSPAPIIRSGANQKEMLDVWSSSQAAMDTVTFSCAV